MCLWYASSNLLLTDMMKSLRSSTLLEMSSHLHTYFQLTCWLPHLQVLIGALTAVRLSINHIINILTSHMIIDLEGHFKLICWWTLYWNRIWGPNECGYSHDVLAEITYLDTGNLALGYQLVRSTWNLPLIIWPWCGNKIFTYKIVTRVKTGSWSSKMHFYEHTQFLYYRQSVNYLLKITNSRGDHIHQILW